MSFVLQSILLLFFLSLCGSVEIDDWKPTSWQQCRTNTDCHNMAAVCCSITPALGKRQLGFPLEVNYCLPYKREGAPWCDLRMQHSPDKLNYHGLCPCAPGLKCMQSTEIDSKNNRYGKCIAAIV